MVLIFGLWSLVLVSCWNVRSSFYDGVEGVVVSRASYWFDFYGLYWIVTMPLMFVLCTIVPPMIYALYSSASFLSVDQGGFELRSHSTYQMASTRLHVPPAPIQHLFIPSWKTTAVQPVPRAYLTLRPRRKQSCLRSSKSSNITDSERVARARPTVKPCLHSLQW